MPEIVNAEQMAALDPPEGWTWQQRPPRMYDDWDWGILVCSATRQSQFEAAHAALMAWAEEHYMALHGYGQHRFRDTPRTAWNNVMVCPQRAGRLGRLQGGIRAHWSQPWYRQFNNETLQNLDWAIRPGEACAVDTCNTVAVPLARVQDKWVCYSHARLCRNTDNLGRSNCRVPVVSIRRFCDAHTTIINCLNPACEETGELGQAGWHNADGRVRNADAQRMLCRNCYLTFCNQCDRFNRPNVRERADGPQGLVCAECHQKYLDGRNEQYAEDVDNITAEDLLLEAKPIRPVRVCSIEMETTTGGERLAEELYRAGLTPHGQVQGYHFRPDPDAFCHVEHDSSLGPGGGELIFNRMRLDDPEEVQNLHAGIKIVRKLIKEGRLGMDLRCGLHIHVDAHQFGVPHVRNLVLLFNYLEDPLYRLAAAHYGQHRGYGYANKLIKGGMKDAQEFGVNFFGTNGHAHALHVGNYWQQMRNNCGCGAAIVGNHDKCVCNLGKCTFEFRVWNGTANFRKVHAYAAISQSLVAFARLIPDLPEEEYEASNHTNHPIKPEEYEGLKERLCWMFRNLYFSPKERESVLYVVRNSSLAELPPDILAEVEATQYVELQPTEIVEPKFFGARKNPERTPDRPGPIDLGGVEIDFDPEFFDDDGDPY